MHAADDLRLIARIDPPPLPGIAPSNAKARFTATHVGEFGRKGRKSGHRARQ